jgi:hypothetical protein
MATSEVRVHDALVALQGQMAAVRLPLETSGAAQGRKERHNVLEQLDDYVLPRLRALDAPLLAVVGGSTGSGKSTLANSIVGRPVTAAGVLRPTTRSPVLMHNSVDQSWFDSPRILPDLPRVTGPGADGELQLAAADSLPVGLALLDAPDFDSIVVSNRELSVQLLAAADLWLYITTAARYADAVPWSLLEKAAERNVAVAVVLDRVDTDAIDTIRADLAAMLTRNGLGTSPLFVIPEVRLDDEGLLPSEASEPVQQWLRGLVADEAARSAVIRRTLDGAITSMQESAETIAEAYEHQVVADAGLRAIVKESYTVAAEKIDVAIADGSVLRGEVLARWQDFVGTGEFFRVLDSGISRVRDRFEAFVRGRPQPTAEVEAAIAHGVQAVLIDEANEAAERAETGWRASQAGRELLGDDDLSRARDDVDDRSAAVVRAWQGAVLELVRSEGANKRFTARAVSIGVNGMGLAVMIAVFASTDGRTGAEVGSAGGTAVVGQRLLEAVFGEQAARHLAERARRDLNDRVMALLKEESSRFTDRLDSLDVDERTPGEIRGAIIEVRHARSEAA